jgi:hypothetical protein
MIDQTTALLIRARSFVERGWCRGTFAANSEGWSVEPTDEDAVRWCARAAVDAAAGQIVGGDHPAFRRLAAAIGVDGIYAADFAEAVADFNDRQETAEPILAAFDRAIATVAEGECIATGDQ